ncbi:MAG: hypothetical protein R3B45_03390 [Bdellovibrionota bacterium]
MKYLLVAVAVFCQLTMACKTRSTESESESSLNVNEEPCFMRPAGRGCETDTKRENNEDLLSELASDIEEDYNSQDHALSFADYEKFIFSSRMASILFLKKYTLDVKMCKGRDDSIIKKMVQNRFNACWHNPAAEKLPRAKKLFYCSMPLEFRTCNSLLIQKLRKEGSLKTVSNREEIFDSCMRRTNTMDFYGSEDNEFKLSQNEVKNAYNEAFLKIEDSTTEPSKLKKAWDKFVFNVFYFGPNLSFNLACHQAVQAILAKVLTREMSFEAIDSDVTIDDLGINAQENKQFRSLFGVFKRLSGVAGENWEDVVSEDEAEEIHNVISKVAANPGITQD